MNETEREALKSILFALFLESPKRKVLQSFRGTERSGEKTPSKQIRKYKLEQKKGETRNGKEEAQT